MIRLHCQGGFGEKGRVSLGIEAEGRFVILDVGINTNAAGPQDPAYHPAIGPDALRRADAILVSHAHEDHIGGLGWCFAHGFAGTVYMTAPTLREMDGVLAGYDPGHAGAVDRAAIRVIAPGEPIDLGRMAITTGRAGHTAGSVWARVAAAGTSLGYCADTVPGSSVLAVDPMPAADTLVIDASSGLEDVPADVQRASIAAWVEAHAGSSLIPTPLLGKPLDLLVILSGPIAIHRAMRASLAEQIADRDWLRPGIGDLLRDRLAAAIDWQEGEPWPDRPLMVHDGIGLAGPARNVIPQAESDGVPVLLTGHLPSGSPVARLREKGAALIRVPTHPTLAENRALVAASGARRVIAHSCSAPTGLALQPHLAGLVQARTGDVLALSD